LSLLTREKIKSDIFWTDLVLRVFNNLRGYSALLTR
jgi:hypothetical protein